jgi:hypothetical protein
MTHLKLESHEHDTPKAVKPWTWHTYSCKRASLWTCHTYSCKRAIVHEHDTPIAVKEPLHEHDTLIAVKEPVHEHDTLIAVKGKTKKYHIVWTITKSNRKIVETETKSIPLTHILIIHFSDVTLLFEQWIIFKNLVYSFELGYIILIWFLCFNATFRNIMATSFSGGRSRREPPTMGKQLV